MIQADLVGHLVMEPDGSCYDRVVALFGKQVIKNDKTIDRKMVSDVVFGSEIMRQSLDAIIHPAVRQYILNQIEQQREAGCSLVVVEAALLLEEKYDAFCDQVWYVHTDQEIRIERLMKRQASEAFFRQNTDCVITNNGLPEETWRQIEEGIKKL